MNISLNSYNEKKIYIENIKKNKQKEKKEIHSNLSIFDLFK